MNTCCCIKKSITVQLYIYREREQFILLQRIEKRTIHFLIVCGERRTIHFLQYTYCTTIHSFTVYIQPFILLQCIYNHSFFYCVYTTIHSFKVYVQPFIILQCLYNNSYFTIQCMYNHSLFYRVYMYNHSLFYSVYTNHSYFTVYIQPFILLQHI